MENASKLELFQNRKRSYTHNTSGSQFSFTLKHSGVHVQEIGCRTILLLRICHVKHLKTQYKYLHLLILIFKTYSDKLTNTPPLPWSLKFYCDISSMNSTTKQRLKKIKQSEQREANTTGQTKQTMNYHNNYKVKKKGYPFIFSNEIPQLKLET